MLTYIPILAPVARSVTRDALARCGSEIIDEMTDSTSVDCQGSFANLPPKVREEFAKTWEVLAPPAPATAAYLLLRAQTLAKVYFGSEGRSQVRCEALSELAGAVEATINLDNGQRQPIVAAERLLVVVRDWFDAEGDPSGTNCPDRVILLEHAGELSAKVYQVAHQKKPTGAYYRKFLTAMRLLTQVRIRHLMGSKMKDRESARKEAEALAQRMFTRADMLGRGMGLIQLAVLWQPDNPSAADRVAFRAFEGTGGTQRWCSNQAGQAESSEAALVTNQFKAGLQLLRDSSGGRRVPEWLRSCLRVSESTPTAVRSEPAAAGEKSKNSTSKRKGRKRRKKERKKKDAGVADAAVVDADAAVMGADAAVVDTGAAVVDAGAAVVDAGAAAVVCSIKDATTENSRSFIDSEHVRWFLLSSDQCTKDGVGMITRYGAKRLCPRGLPLHGTQSNRLLDAFDGERVTLFWQFSDDGVDGSTRVAAYGTSGSTEVNGPAYVWCRK